MMDCVAVNLSWRTILNQSVLTSLGDVEALIVALHKTTITEDIHNFSLKPLN
jgi:hypothetical protein